MKTIDEVERWCTGAAVETGDPSLPIGQIFCRFVTEPSNEQDLILAACLDQKLHIDFGGGWLPIAIDTDGPRIDRETGVFLAFGIEQICPGFWTLTPSINMPGIIHVFAHIYNVPSPAPWESLIIPATVIGASMRTR